jgi:hypothetical protein
VAKVVEKTKTVTEEELEMAVVMVLEGKDEGLNLSSRICS